MPFLLSPFLWWPVYLAGLASNWQLANAPLESLRSHRPTSRIRTQLLRLSVEKPVMPRLESPSCVAAERKLYLVQRN